ncbi:MAG TPA: Rieske (2Fe-2S) protein [Nitrososphaeraceae archaeon]|nr:Rieske (2Fe-2S) protein [Nitrososphaeraceae archaeon]
MLSKTDNHNYVYVANTREIEAAGGRLSVTVKKYTVAIFIYDSKVYAVDIRCPHMGFPLNQGTVKDGILTCHWHHARFDLMNGGTFDQWAGDVTSFPVEIRNENEVWIDISAAVVDNTDSHHQNQTLLLNGLKRNIPLLIAKTIIPSLGTLRNRTDTNEKEIDGMLNVFSIGLNFGSHYKQSGWGQGLTIHTCMMNIVPYLGIEDMPYALYHGLSAVAQDCVSMPPRFKISPLPEPWPDLSTLKFWFRQFVESRDAQAAERCIVTAVRLGVDNRDIADMLFAAATDHRYLDVGHVLDFTNKALEALDSAGWDNNNNKDLVESVLSSLVSGYANAERMEESNSWRYPIDLIDILEKAFKKLPAVLENGRREQSEKKKWNQRNQLLTVLLGDDPQLIVNSLLEALSQGAREEELAGIVAYTAALRIAQFHTRNEFSDWDTSLHTFTYANAVHQGLRRIATHELLRGMFDGAIRVYLNRFLNIPPVPLPEPKKMENISNDSIFREPEILLKELLSLLDKQQQVNQAGQLVVDYLYNNGKPDRLLAAIGKALLREDRNFHSIQMIEAAFRQYSFLSANDYETNSNSTTGVHILVAAARYLAAHSPTMRSQGHTYQTANQLYHGEHLFEG